LTKELKDAIPEAAKKKWEKTHVGRGGTHEHEVTISEIGTTLEWEFRTDAYDVGFGLHYKDVPDSPKPEHLVPYERVESHKSTVYGLWVAEKTGHYVLAWDNSYSWTHGKDLKFIVKVSQPLTDSVTTDTDTSTSVSEKSSSPSVAKKSKRKGKK